MKQSRTHTCGELRLSDAGKQVTIVGWLENVRKSAPILLSACCGISTAPPSSWWKPKR